MAASLNRVLNNTRPTSMEFVQNGTFKKSIGGSMSLSGIRCTPGWPSAAPLCRSQIAPASLRRAWRATARPPAGRRVAIEGTPLAHPAEGVAPLGVREKTATSSAAAAFPARDF